jgi:hypothetical protein
MIILIDFVLIYLLDCGYCRGELDYYDMMLLVMEMLHITFAHCCSSILIVIFNAVLLFSSSRLLMNGGYPGVKLSFIFLYVIYLFNIVNSLLFSVKNHIRNYIEVFN